MSAWRKHIGNEAGQAIIQVTVSMLVIIAFVALAIDFGRVFSERRNLQNAADAAALAGARELCQGKTVDAARAKAKQTLIDNAVPAANIDDMSDITFSGTSSNTINVKARHPSMNAVIGQIVSWSNIDVGAEAAAACGAATSGCGLWPMSLSTQAWKDVTTSGSACVVRQIAVWNDDEDNKNAKAPRCEISGVTHTNLCDCYQCPLDKDGNPKFVLVASEGQAWLDFSSVADPNSVFQDECLKPGGGTSELNCQIARNMGMKISLPACIEGIQGVRASTKKEINARSGTLVRIPLYDTMNCVAKPKDSYRVTSLGCFKVDGWTTVGDLTSNKNIQPKAAYPTLPEIKKNEKIVLATSDCSNSCMTACGGTDGTTPVAGQLRAVSLIK